MDLSDIRTIAQTLFLKGVRAADPGLAVQRALVTKPLRAAPDGRLILIAFGKAACAMAEQALQHVPSGQSVEAIAVTNYENARDVTGCKVLASGHPLPDQNGLNAGLEVMRLLDSAGENDEVLCLISGGGSALLPAPREGLSLDDKIRVSQILLSEGLDITQMNAIRQQLSRLKGGGLIDLAHPAKVRSLIISDVVGDEISAIASGPTAPEMTAFHDTIALLKSRKIWAKLPESARILLETPRLITARDADNMIICSNAQSLSAIAAAAPEWSPIIAQTPLIGDVVQAAKHIAMQAARQTGEGRRLLIWGGETTVQLTGDGKGGRNQEMAVRIATLADQIPGQWVFLSGGTDGRDGPTDAAGGLVTPNTVSRARAENIDVADALGNNDSYHVLKAAGDLLTTGATGTNVADIQLMFLLG